MTYLSSFFILSPPFAGIPFDFRCRARFLENNWETVKRNSSFAISRAPVGAKWS